jgi:quinohemoprotein amine dehydrogenase
MKKRPSLRGAAPLLILLGAAVSVLAAQDVKSPGIPVDDKLTITKCGGCHTRDTSGLMRRISYERTTPEVWDQIIKRMIRLNGVRLTPDETRRIVRYLSNNNGLAPEEAKPIMWEVEHRLFRNQEEEDGQVPEALQHTCNYCHTIGRVLSQRRTREDYMKLANTHVALFPGAEPAVFKPVKASLTAEELPVRSVDMTGSGMPTLDYPTAHKPAGNKFPIDIAVDYLASKQPLITPEWTAWKAVMHAPKLTGTWLVNGYQKGKGRVYGQMTITAGDTPEDFITKVELHYASTGATTTRAGKGVVYTGYSWRGRTQDSTVSKSTDPNASAPEVREAMMLSRDGNSMEGRWFWGGYQEFGLDVQLVRLGSEPVVLGTDKFSLQSPSTGEFKIYGGNFSKTLKPSDIDLGPGVKVSKIVHVTPTEATVQVAVDSGLPVSVHDVAVNGATAVKAFTVYDKVGYIKVTPDANFARLGGTIAAKQYAQFETIAFSNGPDGIAGTADDVALGPVSANWSMEEFISTPDDDDVKFVGSVNDSGLFTPAVEGPNPVRKKQANNFATENWGDVWVDASYQVPGGKLLKARSYLVVTIPEYVIYDQPEVSQ